MTADTNLPVVLFDGDCGFCARSIQFILDHNDAGDLYFAPLQSPLAAELCGQHDIDPTKLDTLVFITGQGAFRYSDAALKIAKHLDRPWSLGAVGLVVPRPVRDRVYRFVAKHRMRLAPPPDACRLPTPTERSRFLA